MDIDVRDNFPAVKAAIAADAKQGRFALAVALTRTAQDVRKDERVEMSTVFDRPTPFTLNSLFVKPATKADLQSRVWLKDSERPSHYLLPQIQGGARQLKRFEALLVQRGLMRSDERAVPAAGAKTDGYGNVSRGQITKILSQLQTFTLAGSDANATSSKRSRAKRAREAYFVSTGSGTHPFGRRSWKNGRMRQELPRGIWSRVPDAVMGSKLKPVMLFVSQVLYAKRFRFFEVANRTVDRVFVGHFEAAYAQATRTARPGGGAA